MYQLKVDRCLWCQQPLVQRVGSRQVRSDKVFCGAQHRMAYNRWLKNIEKREAQAAKAIKNLCEYLQHPKAQQYSMDAVVRLKALIDDEVKANGVRIVR